MDFDEARDTVGHEIGRIRGIIVTLEASGADEFALEELRTAERNLTEALPGLRNPPLPSYIQEALNSGDGVYRP
jgi:hypothetical protein